MAAMGLFSEEGDHNSFSYSVSVCTSCVLLCAASLFANWFSSLGVSPLSYVLVLSCHSPQIITVFL